MYHKPTETAVPVNESHTQSYFPNCYTNCKKVKYQQKNCISLSKRLHRIRTVTSRVREQRRVMGVGGSLKGAGLRLDLDHFHSPSCYKKLCVSQTLVRQTLTYSRLCVSVCAPLLSLSHSHPQSDRILIYGYHTLLNSSIITKTYHP